MRKNEDRWKVEVMEPMGHRNDLPTPEGANNGSVVIKNMEELADQVAHLCTMEEREGSDKITEMKNNVRILATLCGCDRMIDPKFGDMWDGGDLQNMCELVKALIEQGTRKIAINMAHVKSLPSGTFNVFCGWAEQGVTVVLLFPREMVRKFRWFRFCEAYGEYSGAFQVNPRKEFFVSLDEAPEDSPEGEGIAKLLPV